jgi:hypothetical protein
LGIAYAKALKQEGALTYVRIVRREAEVKAGSSIRKIRDLPKVS